MRIARLDLEPHSILNNDIGNNEDRSIFQNKNKYVESGNKMLVQLMFGQVKLGGKVIFRDI